MRIFSLYILFLVIGQFCITNRTFVESPFDNDDSYTITNAIESNFELNKEILDEVDDETSKYFAVAGFKYKKTKWLCEKNGSGDILKSFYSLKLLNYYIDLPPPIIS